MIKWSEKEAFEAISKEQLIELFELSAQLMLTCEVYLGKPRSSKK